MMFLGFVSHERLNLFAGFCILGIKVPLSTFSDAFADAPAKGTILTLMTQTALISNGENCSVDSLYWITRP